MHDTDDAFHDVVDVGEVAFAVAVVEDLNGLACLQFLRCGEVEHVRAACRTVNGKEAETGGRNIVELAVAVRQKLVGLFSGRVEGDRVIDLVFNCEGHFFVAAVYGRTGGVDQMLDACGSVVIGVAAGFEDVVETDQVALDVDVRVIDGVADACLRRQVDDDGGLVYCEYFVDQGLVRDAASDENMPDRGVDRVDHAKTVLLELRIIVIIHVVEADYSAAGELAAKAHDKVGTDKAGRAGDQDGSAVQIDGSFAHFYFLISVPKAPVAAQGACIEGRG